MRTPQRTVFAVIVLMALAACAPAKPLRPGPLVAPPYGYTDLCIRDPENLACRPPGRGAP